MADDNQSCFETVSGHMGIADSRGVIYDFAGPYTIGEDNMAFGRPTRYLQLDPGRCKGEHWDEAVAHSSETYRYPFSWCGRRA